MPLHKRLLRNNITLSIISWLLAAYIRLVFLTSRIERSIDPQAQAYMQGEKNALFAFWHGRMMMLPAFLPPKRKMHVLISLHRDGQLISRIIAGFRLATVAGSSSRGGRVALHTIFNILDSGDNVAITPDGPRGPARKVTRGTIAIAQRSEKPLLPVGFSASRATHLHSWDRFLLALPFGRISFYVGAPMYIEDMESDAARSLLQHALDEACAKADGMVHA